MQKLLIKSIFILLLTFLLSINLLSLEKKGSIKMEVKGFKNNNGNARILIFSAKERKAFPGEHEKAFARYVVPIKNNKLLFTFDNLPFGDYAISVHHDENANDKLETNLFGIPKEPLGCSNDAKGNFGPPSFEQAKVMLYIEKVSIEINMVN